MAGFALLNAVCGAIVIIMVVGLYRAKVTPRAVEIWLVQRSKAILMGICTLLVLIVMTQFGVVTGLLSLPSRFIDAVSLIVHEAGHYYLSWASPFVHALGGTLFEIGVPFGLAIYATLRGYYRFAALALIWVSAAAFSIAPYIASTTDLADQMRVGTNAQALADVHDWYRILGSTQSIDHAPFLAEIFASIGAGVGICACFLFAGLIGWNGPAGAKSAMSIGQD